MTLTGHCTGYIRLHGLRDYYERGCKAEHFTALFYQKGEKGTLVQTLPETGGFGIFHRVYCEAIN